MINVTVYRDSSHHYRGFRCEGHAGYADSGEDIVCSAVSVLVFNTINAIDQLTEDAYELGTDPDTGLVDVSFPENLHHDAALLMKAMVMGLASIEENYSDFIHFEIEEV
jgi:uncharacterized protein YsxB (DUF464 family)